MKVLITREIPQSGIEILENHPEIQLDYRKGPPLSTEELKNAIKGVDAIISVIPDLVTGDVIKAAGPQLKLVANYAVGYDNIEIEEATKLGVYVSNTPGDLTESVAEHTVALMFAVGKHIVEGDKYIRQGKFKYWDPMIYLGPKFMGKTLGIIGFGRIGQHLARIAKNGLNMRILYNDAMEKEKEEKETGAQFCEIPYLLENSDVVSMNCNLTDETCGMIGERELRMMKPTAYFINTARGAIVKEDALAVALKEKWIEGAGLDVFENEPEINPVLLELDNVVLTPHTASATREARIQMARMAAENVVEVLINNKPPVNLVNKEVLKNS